MWARQIERRLQTIVRDAANTLGAKTLDERADAAPNTSVFLHRLDVIEAEIKAAGQGQLRSEEVDDLLGFVHTVRFSFEDQAFLKDFAEVVAGPAQIQPQVFCAVDDGDIEGVSAALETWDVHTQVGRSKETVLYRAMTVPEGPSLDIINLILDAGADPSFGLGSTNVLHGVGFANWTRVLPEALAAVINRCVQGGADIEQRPAKLGWTPLLLAASEWNSVAVEGLLLAGANPFADAGDVGGGGEDADALSFAQGHPKTVAILKTFMTRN